MTKSQKKSKLRKSRHNPNLSPENTKIDKIKGTSTVTKECDRFTKRISEVNAELELKEMQIEQFKRGLDQERLLKEAAIRNLTRLMFTQSITSDDKHQLTAEGDAFVDRRRNLLKMDDFHQQREEATKLKSIMTEYEKKLHEKEIQLAALNDQATRLIRIYHRNRLEIEAMNLGIAPAIYSDEVTKVPTTVEEMASIKNESSKREKSSSSSVYSL